MLRVQILRRPVTAESFFSYRFVRWSLFEFLLVSRTSRTMGFLATRRPAPPRPVHRIAFNEEKRETWDEDVIFQTANTIRGKGDGGRYGDARWLRSLW